MHRETLAKRFVAEDAETWLKLSPLAKETFDAIALYLAEGGQLSPKVIKWFAQRVIDPKLLRSKRGRKPTPMLHHQIQYWMRILSVDMGYTVADAVGLLAGCAAKSPEHVRDIWYSAPKASG